MRDQSKKVTDIHQQLIEDCRRGSRKAQTQLYRLYYKAMFNTSLRIVNRREVAEDIMQESFMKAFMKIRQFRGDVSFGAWLKKIVINGSVDYLRQYHPAFEKITDFENKLAGDETPEIDNDITISDIRKEIEKLADGYRIVLSLYLLEGYDHDEIAGILNISPSTSRSQLARAKKVLAQNLKKLKR
jgi:RNA polymerase sigma-70 factor (ECF subfamily)